MNSLQMTTREARLTPITKMMEATCVSTIYFPRERKEVVTTKRWVLGKAKDGRWCASNGRDNGRWFPNREALEAYARFLSARDWKVTVA